MDLDRRKLITLAGTLVLVLVVAAAGIYGPSAWKVFMNRNARSDQVVIQNPPVDQTGASSLNTDKTGQGSDVKTPPKTASTSTSSTGTAASQGELTSPPQADQSGTKKYKEPDLTQMDLAPSISGYFNAGENGLSDSAKTLAYQSAWNIHEYVDGYLFGAAAGPQMNEQDIKKYIIFHKTLWEKQLKNEVGAAKAAAFTNYLEVLFNRGVDAFDAKDKARIEQFHQEIHDLDAHLFRNDASAKIYGATPFATTR